MRREARWGRGADEVRGGGGTGSARGEKEPSTGTPHLGRPKGLRGLQEPRRGLSSKAPVS